MRYRPHRGGLADSLKEQIEVNSLEELKAHIDKTSWHYKELTIEKYGKGLDERISPPWDTYIVLLDGIPCGWTDGEF